MTISFGGWPLVLSEEEFAVPSGSWKLKPLTTGVTCSTPLEMKSCRAINLLSGQLRLDPCGITVWTHLSLTFPWNRREVPCAAFDATELMSCLFASCEQSVLWSWQQKKPSHTVQIKSKCVSWDWFNSIYEAKWAQRKCITACEHFKITSYNPGGHK